jgi:hypothetical protein
VSALDVLVSLSPAYLGAALGVLLTRGYGRWTKAAAARDKARDELDEIMRWRWWRNPSTQEDREDRAAAQLCDERLPSYLRKAGVPEELISRLRHELDALGGHVQADGDSKVSRADQLDFDRLDEIVDDIHILLDEADRQHQARHSVSLSSRGTNRARAKSSNRRLTWPYAAMERLRSGAEYELCRRQTDRRVALTCAEVECSPCRQEATQGALGSASGPLLPIAAGQAPQS